MVPSVPSSLRVEDKLHRCRKRTGFVKNPHARLKVHDDGWGFKLFVFHEVVLVLVLALLYSGTSPW